MQETALAKTNGNALAPSTGKRFDLAVIEAQLAQWTPVMRELIVQGRKLNDDQIKGRLMFALTHGLDPVTEVHTITDRNGATMSHTMAINGLRRKNQEMVGPTCEIMMDFVELPPEALKKFPGALVGYECRLRDGQSYTQWQKRMVEIGKSMREAGVQIDYKALIELAGPPPIYTGVGFVYQSELSPDYKDKSFNPIERAKKRAEVNARHHRWPTEAPVFDGEDVQITTADGVEVVAHPNDESTGDPAAQTGAFREEKKPTVNSILGDLGFGPEDSPRKTYTREDAARDNPPAPAETSEAEYVDEPEPEDWRNIVDEPEQPAEPAAPKMDLATAEAVMGSDKKAYGTKSDEQLGFMLKSVEAKLADETVTGTVREQYTFKRDAILTIQASRAKKASEQPSML